MTDLDYQTRTVSVPPEPRLRRGALYVAVFAIGAPMVAVGLSTSVDRFVDAGQLADWMKVAGSLLALVGVGLVALATWQLHRQGRGLPLSSHAPVRLVTTGAYRVSRNPIYLGASLCFAGASAMADSPAGVLLGAPLLALFYTTYAIGIEGPVLQARFGAAYAEYCERRSALVAFPGRRMLLAGVGRWLDSLSNRINHPFIVRRGTTLFFASYSLWVGIGITLGLTATAVLLRASGVRGNANALTIIALTIAGLGGTRTAWVVGAVAARLPGAYWRVGFVSWGALAGVLLVALGFSTFTGHSSLLLLDAVLPPLMIAQIFGRIGCAFYGCCSGTETTSRLRLTFRHPALRAVRNRGAGSWHLHPVQLLASLHGALIAGVTLGLWACVPLAAGQPAALTSVLYGICRISEEWLRSQTMRWWGLFSSAQLASLGLIAVGMVVLFSGGSGGRSLDAEAMLHALPELPFFALLLAGALTALVFGYHRTEIGSWR